MDQNKSLLSHHTTKMDGINSMIFNQYEQVTGQSSMMIKSLSSEEMEQSNLTVFKLQNIILNISDTQKFGPTKMGKDMLNWPFHNCTISLITQNCHWLTLISVLDHEIKKIRMNFLIPFSY